MPVLEGLISVVAVGGVTGHWGFAEGATMPDELNEMLPTVRRAQLINQAVKKALNRERKTLCWAIVAKGFALATIADITG